MTEKRGFSEIEVDLEKPAPLNKKQKRLEKKGRLRPPKSADGQESKRSPYAVWIGNLSYETSPEELGRFIVYRSNNTVQESDVQRIHMPPKKGFAFVDLASAEQVAAVVELSESELSGRNLLIKDAKSYAGRPGKPFTESTNPPSSILFVGNLSFDTTDDELRMHFQHCGEISRIRTATFQDSGKCKGFSFIDFTEIEACKKALGDKRCRKLNGRTLRMEYGQDRTKRKPQREREEVKEPTPFASEEASGSNTTSIGTPVTAEPAPRAAPAERRQPRKHSSQRPTSGQTLSNAARGKNSIQPSEGKKITFS